jgi:hypothetical protein
LLLGSLFSYGLFKEWFTNKKASNCLSKICGLFSPEESIYLDKYYNSSDCDLSLALFKHQPLKKRVKKRRYGISSGAISVIVIQGIKLLPILI